MSGTDDLDPIGEDQHPHRGTDEIVAMNEGIGKKLTLSLFFDEHYFPHAQATKRLTHHDWSIFNTHMRASLGKYLLDDLTNPVLDVWVREQLVAGYQRSTINKHIHLMNRMLNLARHWGFVSVQQYQQCLTSAPMGQFRHIAERRVSGSS